MTSWLLGGFMEIMWWVSWRTSLMNFGVVLYVCLNSLGERIWCVVGCWICQRVVLLDMYDL